MKRIRSFLGNSMPVAVSCALFVLAFGRTLNPTGEAPRWLLFLIGWLYGICVYALLRLFRVAPWGYPWLGLFVGPVPATVLLMNQDTPSEERGGVWVLSALLGLLLGIIEWARVRALPAEPDAD